MRKRLFSAFTVSLALACCLLSARTNAQKQFSIEQVLSSAFPSGLVSAKKADRFAWIEFERGRRNVLTAAAPDFTPRALTQYLEDDGHDLSSLRLSDDGSVIVFVRGHTPNRDGWIANPTSAPDGAERAIWAVRTSAGAPWRVVEGSSPNLSPDGRWILFQKDGQIYEVPVEFSSSVPFYENQLKPLFRTHGSNSNYTWSPEGRKIAFVSNRGDHSYIGIYDRETREVRYIAPGVDFDGSPTWSPDGERIAFIRRPGATFARITSSAPRDSRGVSRNRASQMAAQPGFRDAAFEGGHTVTFWVADAGSRKAEKFWHNPLSDSTFLDISRITWAGESVIFRLERNNWQHYYSVKIDGGTDQIPVNLTPGEGEAEFICLSSEGEYLYYSSNVGDIDRRDLWRTPTGGGKAKRLTRGDGIETYPAALSSGKFVAVLYADAKRPLSVALVPAKGGKAEIISSDPPADFPLEQQVVPENVLLTAADGLTFHNQLFVPKDIAPGERRPAILFTHGGPGRQMLLGYHYRHFYHMAYAINQYFANKGYVVISVNYRAGIGYGREFRRAENRGSRGSSEYQDVHAAGRYLQSRPDVDPERIGLWGLSYGGILTAMGLSRNSDIFSAGVDIAGVHLWGSSLDTSSVSFKSSAVATIDNWTSPVLLVHGDDDRNVNFSQTTGLVQLLRAHDIYFELIVYPDDVHSFLIFDRWLRTFNAADDFFERFLVDK